ncbi:DUF4232 domain-containing protein [Actinomadura roseirufa]|uniref:DUF4232 domain-containing protein n=1 Tax=Actinomadura roseirufa TaxID=2094049 RepID=UPI0013F17E65|nr:DUF4232 domain-containing protein [Actinomadura roseirufa]
MLLAGQTAALADNVKAKPGWCQYQLSDVTLKPTDAGAGHRYADLRIKNKSNGVCVLSADVKLQLRDAKGKALPTRVVLPPGKPKRVKLEPGQTAVIKVAWGVVPTGDEPVDRPCQPTPATLDVDLPGQAKPQPKFNVVKWKAGPVCNKGTFKLSSITA